MTPHVTEDVAAAADRARRWVDVAGWTAIVLGLAFTMVNVQTFAAAGAAIWSPGWSVAWLLDPMVSVLLLAVVRAEQVTARWQVAMPWPVTATKWVTFAATYCMNTWASWAHVIPSGVVLHSVPPLVVLLGAEVAPVLRDRLTEAVHAAARATTPAPATPADPVTEPVAEPAIPPDVTPAGGEPAAAATPVTEPEVDEREVDEPVEPVDGPEVDPRVREVAELLAAGCDVTGAQVAAINQVSDRTGRRLLADARTHLEQHPITTGVGLHLVEPTTTGRTA